MWVVTRVFGDRREAREHCHCEEFDDVAISRYLEFVDELAGVEFASLVDGRG